MQWAGFFIKEMQKNKIDIQREILDDFLNLSYVIKTMSNLDRGITRKHNSYEVLFEDEKIDEIPKKHNMVYKKENDWISNTISKDEEQNAKNIWEKFKKLNIHAKSFNPQEFLKNSVMKPLKLESQAFKPNN